MTVSVKVAGLRDLDKQIARLKPATGKSALRRSLRSVAEPIAADMAARAPVDPNGERDLQKSIGVGTKLSKRQARLHRRMFRNSKAAVEMFVGAGPVSEATQQEFGNSRHVAQPFARPAWDAATGSILADLSAIMWANVEKSIARAAKKGALLK